MLFNRHSPTNSHPGGTHGHTLPTDNKYVKNAPSKPKTSCASRLHSLSWIFCGTLCAYWSMEYSMKFFFAGSTSASTLSSPIQNGMDAAQMDTILTPLRSVGASLTPPVIPTLPDYSFDNIATVQPDPLQHAILIPYRDRQFHLNLFLEYMGPYLEHHFPHASFTLWIIEQDDAELFNRAWLANVGLRQIVEHAPQTSCVIFHDVDLVPNMTSHVPYTTCQYPIQLGSELQHFNWTVPYPAYCGGITSLSLKHWQLINGLGNGMYKYVCI